MAAEGAVIFLEILSPALERVDSSSGAMGTAVYHAIIELVPIIANAKVDVKTRQKWLDRLYQAHANDQMPYIEILADYWGDLSASKEIASIWADQLIDITRMAWSSDENLRGHFHGASACLSALYRAERYDEILTLIKDNSIWPYKQWAVKALAAMGKIDEAINYAESSRYKEMHSIDSLCESILISSGRIEEAYQHYGMQASHSNTYLMTFRTIAKKYPNKSAREILADLIKSTPSSEGKWFAAAKESGLYEEAIEIAGRSACDPKTLTRASRDYIEEEPAFAVKAGMLALYWISKGYGYEIAGMDVLDAYTTTMKAAEKQGCVDKTHAWIRNLVLSESKGSLLHLALGREFV